MDVDEIAKMIMASCMLVAPVGAIAIAALVMWRDARRQGDSVNE